MRKSKTTTMRPVPEAIMVQIQADEVKPANEGAGMQYKCYYTPYGRPEILLGKVDWRPDGLGVAKELAWHKLADMIAGMWLSDAKRYNPEITATLEGFEHSARKYCYPRWIQVDDTHWNGLTHDAGSIVIPDMVCLRIELVESAGNA